MRLAFRIRHFLHQLTAASSVSPGLTLNSRRQFFLSLLPIYSIFPLSRDSLAFFQGMNSTCLGRCFTPSSGRLIHTRRIPPPRHLVATAAPHCRAVTANLARPTPSPTSSSQHQIRTMAGPTPPTELRFSESRHAHAQLASQSTFIGRKIKIKIHKPKHVLTSSLQRTPPSCTCSCRDFPSQRDPVVARVGQPTETIGLTCNSVCDLQEKFRNAIYEFDSMQGVPSPPNSRRSLLMHSFQRHHHDQAPQVCRRRQDPDPRNNPNRCQTRPYRPRTRLPPLFHAFRQDQILHAHTPLGCCPACRLPRCSSRHRVPHLHYPDGS